MDGQLPDAMSLAQQAFVAGQQSGRPLTVNAFLVQHGTAMWELGRFGELEPQMRAYVTQNPLIVFARCSLQLAFIELGRLDEARTEFERLAREEFVELPRDWNWLASMFVLAEICVDLGEAKHAEVLYRLLAPYSTRNAVLGWYHTYGSVAFALGRLAALLGRLDEAEAHFETALAANARIRAAMPLAHTESELAKLLLSRGEGEDVERAHALIASARRTAEAMNLVRVKRSSNALALDLAPAQREPVSATTGPFIRERSKGRSPLARRRADRARRYAKQIAASALSQSPDVRALASLDGTVDDHVLRHRRTRRHSTKTSGICAGANSFEPTTRSFVARSPLIGVMRCKPSATVS